MCVSAEGHIRSPLAVMNVLVEIGLHPDVVYEPLVAAVQKGAIL